METEDPPKAATVVALDIILNKRTPRDAAIAIERYRNEAPPDPPHLSARAFAAILPALVAGVPPQEHAPLPATADDIVREIATFLEEDEEVAGETIHARIARAARMLAKFQGRYVLNRDLGDVDLDLRE
jgi:hypothetical protein